MSSAPTEFERLDDDRLALDALGTKSEQPAHGRSRPPGLLPLCRRQDRLPRLLAARVISSCAIGREIRSGDQPSRPHGPATTSPRSFAGPLRRRRGTQRTGACVRWRRPPGLRKSMIHRIWKAFNLQPHRTETFKLSTDPLFVERRAISAAFSCRCLTRLILCVA